MDKVRTFVFWEACYRALGMIKSALRKLRQTHKDSEMRDFIETVELATEAVANGINKAFLTTQQK